ncbi:MAG: GNAT family N-acetyltransferase [Actinomycetales bacterium]|nr:GNAT family N-acetyltransferase [Actinomycetales bacterium]
MDPLDDPVGSALDGAHRRFAQRAGRVRAYDRALSPFAALPADAAADDWVDLARLLGPGGVGTLVAATAPTPEGWVELRRVDGVQMVAPGAVARPARGDAGSDALEFVPLGGDDAEEMLELVTRTEPGPFALRTVEFGGYLGVRDGGRLVAMAGERMNPEGAVEVSAVCTDTAYRGRGLAGRLVVAVAAGIRARGAMPFLHVSAANLGARRLYAELGFRERRAIDFRVLRAPRG